jgi:hypothetical protein
MRNHLKITILGSLALLSLTAGACMVEDDLEGAADEAALVEADVDQTAVDQAGLADLAPVEDVGDTSEPVGDDPGDIYVKPGSGPITTSLHTGRARVGWPAAGIDICGDGCFLCFYPREYDKVFHQNHIVRVVAICGDAAWVRDNYGNDGMMRKDALYNW